MPPPTHTFTFKRVADLAIELDVYLPVANHIDEAIPAIPAVLYFHGGGLTVGNKQSWFPVWLHKRLMRQDIALISADYRLIPPATGYEILQDVNDSIHFLQTDLNALLIHSGYQLDLRRLAVAGSSAGGLCAYLAALHNEVFSCCVLMYAMGGDMLTPQYLTVKGTPFFRNREMLSASDFHSYIYPQTQSLTSMSSSPLAYHSVDSSMPNYPANPRMLLPRLYMQMGVYLDYYTGQHSPSLSASLRALLNAPSKQGSSAMECVLKSHKAIFPQIAKLDKFPSTVLVHGSVDTAVLPQESQEMYKLLRNKSCNVVLHEVPLEEHSFDYAPDSEQKHSVLFDHILEFISSSVRTPS